jgi:hypothetical protein
VRSRVGVLAYAIRHANIHLGHRREGVVLGPVREHVGGAREVPWDAGIA